jgi:hypothetical protein
MRDDFGFEKESRERSFVDCDALGDRSRRGVELFHLATCIALPGSWIVEHSVGENRLDRAHLIETCYLLNLPPDSNARTALARGAGVTFSAGVMVLSFPPAQMGVLPRILVRRHVTEI